MDEAPADAMTRKVFAARAVGTSLPRGANEKTAPGRVRHPGAVSSCSSPIVPGDQYPGFCVRPGATISSRDGTGYSSW